MNDSYGGYTIRNGKRLFIPYSMAGYRTTVAPLEELNENNNRWTITFLNDNIIKLSLGPKRLMKERYPTVDDHHVAPENLGDLYVSSSEYLWSHGVDRGRRSEFFLEIHPDLVLKLKLNVHKDDINRKDCEKLKKYRDCIYISQCRWREDKCVYIEDINNNSNRKLEAVYVDEDIRAADGELFFDGEATLDGEGTVVRIEWDVADDELVVVNDFDGEVMVDEDVIVVIDEIPEDGEVFVDVDIVIITDGEDQVDGELTGDGELSSDGEFLDWELTIVDEELP